MEDSDIISGGESISVDYTNAIENIANQLSSIKELSNQISNLQKNQFNDKQLFIRYLAAQIFSYSDFDKNSLSTLIEKAITNATLLANKLFDK